LLTALIEMLETGDGFGKVVVVAGILTGFAGFVYHFMLMVIWFTQRRRGKED
jgi:hypothetical protein